MNALSTPVNLEIASEHDQTIESLVFAHNLGASQVNNLDIEGRDFLVSHKAVVVTDLEAFRLTPDRTKREPIFADPASFATYFDKYAIDDSVLIGSLTKRNIVATLDYDGLGQPRWGDHTATYQAVVTPEWRALRAVNEKWLTQTEVADFFEIWNHIVVEPDAATMAEVAMNLAGSLNGQFEAKINRANGTATFVYREEVETNQVKVPSKIHFSVWPFEGTPEIKVIVNLRFKIEGGKPKFQMVIQNADRIEMEALKATFAQVSEATGRTVLVAP